MVKAKGAGGQGKVGAKVAGPGGKVVPCRVEPGLGTESSVVRFTPRDEGPHELEVTYDGTPVPGSPFPVEALPPTNPAKVRPPPFLFSFSHFLFLQGWQDWGPLLFLRAGGVSGSVPTISGPPQPISPPQSRQGGYGRG